MSVERAMEIATKIAKAIEAKLIKQVAVIRLIELPEFKYIEISFKPVGANRVQEVSTAYVWQFFLSETTDLNAKAKLVYGDVKALLGLP